MNTIVATERKAILHHPRSVNACQFSMNALTVQEKLFRQIHRCGSLAAQEML
jgi:hypothetical protein